MQKCKIIRVSEVKKDAILHICDKIICSNNILWE